MDVLEPTAADAHGRDPSARPEVWGPALRVGLAIFFLYKGLSKLQWLTDPSILSKRLHNWLEDASAANRWYLELLLPGAPVFAWLVVIGELGLAAALVSGLWTRPIALLGFLMVLNFHLATGELFSPELLADGAGLPVLGGLLALAVGGGRVSLRGRWGTGLLRRDAGTGLNSAKSGTGVNS